MKLVGICGEIGSGKSTFAEMVTQIDPEHSLHLETSTVISELGNTFNVVLEEHKTQLNKAGNEIALTNALLPSLVPELSVMAETTLTAEQLAVDPKDVADNPQWYEKLFVYFNNVRQNPGLLDNIITPQNKDTYRPLLQWIGGYVLYRLDNKLLWFQELMHRANRAQDVGLIALTAPRQPEEGDYVRQMDGKVIKIVRPNAVADTNDITERRALSIVADTIITNNGTLAELAVVAQKVHRDAIHDQLANSYIAHL